MAKFVTHYEVKPDGIHVTVEIPKRRNGEHNDAALGRVLLALNNLPTPDAFDPPEAPEPSKPVIPHAIAQAFQRDLAPPDDDEGEIIPGFRCANGQCVGD